MTSFDGDPDKLASYILALAKKVENVQASRNRCIKDLQVFLETNTNNFVDSLFETLNNKKYLTQTQPPQNENKTVIKSLMCWHNSSLQVWQVKASASKLKRVTCKICKW